MSAQTDTAHRVLLVEDNAGNALTMTALLEDIGCVVDTAASLFEARNHLARTQYALVLLDHHLGDGTGTELLPMLRTANPATHVVLLSGSQESLNQQDKFAGIHRKGGDPEELIKTVKRLLFRNPSE